MRHNHTRSRSTMLLLLLLSTVFWRGSRAFLLVEKVVRPRSPPSLSLVAWLCSTTTSTNAETRNENVPTVSLQCLEYNNNNNNPNNNNNNARPPAILLHGLLGNKRNFGSICTSLANTTNRTLYSLDLRNHGQSEQHCSMTYREMAADVVQFMDDHNIVQADLIGHSIGGKVAQAVSLLYPHKVHGLVVLDIAPVQYTTKEPHWRAVQEILHTLDTCDTKTCLSKKQLDKDLRVSIPDPALRAFCLTNYCEALQDWSIPMHILHANLDVLADFDVPFGKNDNKDKHPPFQFHGDVFFILGGQSQFVKLTHMETIATYFPNHMLTTIKGAGHWVHAQAPEDVTGLLQRFLCRE